MRWVLRLALVVVTVVTVGFNGQWSTVNGQLSTVEEEEAGCGAEAVLRAGTPWGVCASGVATGDSEWLMVSSQLSMVNGEGMTG